MPVDRRFCPPMTPMYLNEMPEPMRGKLVNQEMPDFDDTPCADGKKMAERRISLITTAGLHRHQEPAFVPGQGEYRVIAENTDVAERSIVPSHQAHRAPRG